MSTPVPVVLLHGLRTSATMWRAQVEALTVEGRRDVVAVDLPGHGTRCGEPFTLDEAFKTIDDAVGRVGGRAAVVGMSLGGYLAVAWAARHPDRVDGVIAAGCTARPGGPLTYGWLLAAELIARLPDRGAWLNARSVAAVIPEPGASDLAAGGFALDVVGEVLREIPRLDTRADLAGVQAPMWLVNGRWDHFRLGERSALKAAPQARLVVVPGSTHLVSVVAPQTFTRILFDALDEIDGGQESSGAVRPEHVRRP